MDSLLSTVGELLAPHEARDGSRLMSRGSIAWAALWLVPLVVFLTMVPSTVPRRIVIPVLMIGLNLGMTCLFGRVGLVASAPALVYGCSAIAWATVYSEAVLKTGVVRTIAGCACVLLILATCVCLLAKRGCRDVGWFMVLTLVMTAVLWWTATARTSKAISIRTGHNIINTGYLLAILSAVWLSLVRAGHWYTAQRGMRGVWPKLLHGGFVLVAGLLPLLVGRVLSAAGAWPVLVAVALCYGGLGLGICRFCPRLPGDLGLLLLPSVLLGGAFICGQAGVELLPPYNPGITIIPILQSQPVAGAVAALAQPIVEAFTSVFSGPLAVLLGAIMRPKAWSRFPELLMSAFCLMAGIGLLALLVRLTGQAVSKGKVFNFSR